MPNLKGLDLALTDAFWQAISDVFDNWGLEKHIDQIGYDSAVNAQINRLSDTIQVSIDLH